jgi:uncharacterized membrane protein YozB (DUF420 family)
MAFLGLEVWQLPALNASLNAVSAVFLVLAFLFIRTKRIRGHWISILLALGCSALFLLSYLVYHYLVGHVPYGGSGWIRWVYYGVLLTHALLAAAILPLIGITITLALRRRPRHPIYGRVTLAAWLYVSVTGVVIFWMLRPYATNHVEQHTHVGAPALQVVTNHGRPQQVTFNVR